MPFHSSIPAARLATPSQPITRRLSRTIADLDPPLAPSGVRDHRTWQIAGDQSKGETLSITETPFLHCSSHLCQLAAPRLSTFVPLRLDTLTLVPTDSRQLDCSFLTPTTNVAGSTYTIMDSIFESSIFDPSSSEPSFLSFSSLADLQVYDFGASSPEPSHLIDWDAPKLEKQLSNDSGYRSDVTAESPSSSNGFLSDKYQGLSACLPIAGSARSSFSGSDDYPLLVTPTRQPSGPNPFSMESNRSSSSSYYADNYPPTPSLTNKSSCDSFASFSTAAGDYNLPSAGYQWDERSLGSSMGGYTSSMPEAGPSKQVAHRCVSNPALSSTASSSKHRAIVNRASMPALKEEEASLQSWSFEQANSYQPVLEPTTEDMLVEDLDWVFREKSGLGLGPDDVYPSGPAQPDWDTAATVQLEPAAEIYAPASPTQQFAWTTQQIPTPIEDPSTYIDPMSTFESNSYYQGRPMTAPGGGAGGDYGASAGPSTHGVNMGMVGGSGMNCPEMLSVPQASMMSRR